MIRRGEVPRRSVKVPDELWHAAKAKARRHDEYLSEVIRRLLETWVAEEDET